ncbi:uncharacterized protein LOC142974234 isoform X2 [Anticarsia gemmatalis]|uniref:uncharacterized protein LOC142974234 isoform X2 n=1 Tax=Anticarsia gemmatalis TaxID=129554 RepID=UPI003F777570
MKNVRDLTKKKDKPAKDVTPKVSLKVNKVKSKKPPPTKLKSSPKVNKFNNKPSVVKTNSPRVNNVKEKRNIPTVNGNNKPMQRNQEKKPKKAKKRKHNQEETQDLDQNPDTQNFDELLLNAKKKKFNEVIENEDQEDLLFSDSSQKKKKKKKVINNTNVNNNEVKREVMSKKMKLKAMLDSNRSKINVGNKSNALRERMLERLKAAQFRYLNEKLYTSSGCEAQQLFQNDPAAFQTYHQGYQLQVKKWPVNPLDVIVKKIMKMPKTHLIADMGCGEAALSRRIPHSVRSFDLVSSAPGVEACDMARTPLLTASVDVAVYCLALMGTDLTQYLVEANRVLKLGGHLLIAEVESRFDNVENFTKEVSRLGFKLKQLDKSNKVFFFMEFTKTGAPPVKKGKLPAFTLKPCLYKKR